MEFVLQDAQEPHLFVIRKQLRRQVTAKSADTLAAYYILDGNIYQAPTLHAVISSRMVSHMLIMTSIIDLANLL